MARRLRTRLLLKALVALGILLMPIAPFMRIRNEGIGGPPGPISRSAKWQMVSYVLMPIGAGLAIASGFLRLIDEVRINRQLDLELEVREESNIRFRPF